MVTLTGILGISFDKSFRCFRNSQTDQSRIFSWCKSFQRHLLYGFLGILPLMYAVLPTLTNRTLLWCSRAILCSFCLTNTKEAQIHFNLNVDFTFSWAVRLVKQTQNNNIWKFYIQLPLNDQKALCVYCTLLQSLSTCDLYHRGFKCLASSRASAELQKGLTRVTVWRTKW